MTSVTHELAPARIVRFTGAMYLIQMATGVFTQLHARGSLIVRNDAAQTAQNITRDRRTAVLDQRRHMEPHYVHLQSLVPGLSDSLRPNLAQA